MILERYDNLRCLVQKDFSEGSQQLVDKALDFASERLSGLSRYDGNPMLCHGVNVAQIVIAEVGLGINSTLATILHDVVRIAFKVESSEDETKRDSFVELTTRIKELFGEEVLGIAMGLCNISQIKLKTESKQVDNFRELIISYSTDPRVILIKLADRLEVMRSIEIFPPHKWHKKSWESLHLYAQIAHKLGLYRIKSELEDLALKYLEPKIYHEIEAKLAEGEAERQAFIKSFIEPINERLSSTGIKYYIKGRTKSIFSIWNKIHNHNIPFEGIYDIFAIRIVIDCERELEKQQCWMAYSLVSDCYTPNPQRLKDWITIPKSNGYESLHTTVAAGGGRWVEIQIRTERMDAVAERGMAAHWRYKGVNQGAQSAEKWMERLRELMDVTTDSIADRFDAAPASDEIFIFTPNGDIRKLREGATLLDFAFDIHSNIGATCVGGRINGRSGSIREKLTSGDIVEILTQKNQTPKADWLNIVVTSKARTKIKSILREQKAQSAQIGREELERKIKNWKLTIPMDEAVAYLCKEYKVRTGTQLYEMIALQKVDISQIKEVLQRLISGEAEEQRRAAAAEVERYKQEKAISKITAQNNQSSGDALIIDEGINNLDYKLGNCCNPIKGDDIFGFVTVSSGVTIHRSDCPNAARLRERYPYRVMEAAWKSSSVGAFRVTIAVVMKDRNGVTNQITEVISRDLKLVIRNISITSRPDGTAAGSITVEVPSTGVVDTLIHSILRVKGVMRSYRTNN
ncbi:MAG: RelA/SpoT family protein [Rikenellaceae bacterium]